MKKVFLYTRIVTPLAPDDGSSRNEWVFVSAESPQEAVLLMAKHGFGSMDTDMSIVYEEHVGDVDPERKDIMTWIGNDLRDFMYVID